MLAPSLAGARRLAHRIGHALVATAPVNPRLMQAKALGDVDQDVVYAPGDAVPAGGDAGHISRRCTRAGGPFTTDQVRTYTLQGGNGVCLTQLPASLTPSAIQLQVFGIPTTAASGDIEILPQAGTFGSTATMVYLGNVHS